MADFIINKLTIRCKDIDQKEKIKQMLFMYDEKNKPIFTMAKLLPYPEGYSENPIYTEIGYYWFCAAWGTNWDARFPKVLDSGNSITIIYDTAWNPNSPWVITLCRFIHDISYSLNKQEFREVSVTHFYVEEYEDFGTLMTWTFIDGEYNLTENISVSSHIPNNIEFYTKYY